MYTAEITNKTIQRVQRQVVVDVTFDNGTERFKKQLVFGMDVSFDQVKQAIKSYIEKLEAIDSNIDTIAVGTVDLTGVESSVPTQAELDKQLWQKRDGIRDKVDVAIQKGYLTGSEPKVIQLKTWLTNNFKPEYLDLM